eukprot:1395255-Amorphochlora_amoeboformis.AAC.1
MATSSSQFSSNKFCNFSAMGRSWKMAGGGRRRTESRVGISGDDRHATREIIRKLKNRVLRNVKSRTVFH